MSNRTAERLRGAIHRVKDRASPGAVLAALVAAAALALLVRRQQQGKRR